MDSVSGVLENSGKFSGKLKQILFGKSIFLMKNDGDDGVNAKQHFISRKAFVIARWREEF